MNELCDHAADLRFYGMAEDFISYEVAKVNGFNL